MLDKLLNNFWFEDVNNMNIQFEASDCEVNQMIDYIKQFQNGDFKSKKEFLNYFLYSTEHQIFVLGMRLFMAIASHKDFELLGDFLSECEEEQLRVFLAYVQESMSLYAIPYLLSLYEVWEGMDVGKDIARCICEMLGQIYYDEQTYDVEQLGESFIEFVNNHDINCFYYDGDEYFSGDLTKKVISVAVDCYNKKEAFYADQMSSILSNSSGQKCPVHYGIEIDDAKVKELYDYVYSLSLLEQKRGEKYFYKHKVE